MKSTRFHFFHLLNNRSGSPIALTSIIQALLDLLPDACVRVFTSDACGPLRQSRSPITVIRYVPGTTRLAKLAAFAGAQLRHFIAARRSLGPHDIAFVNTLLPFGAAIGARLAGSRVIYIVHEVSLRPAFVLRFLREVARIAANDICFVSHVAKASIPSGNYEAHVIPNAVRADIWERALHFKRVPRSATRFLMVCSNRHYKGISTFVLLADRFPDLSFRLVLDASDEEAQSVHRLAGSPINLECFGSSDDLTTHYTESDVIMNLSNPDYWVETFGLTLIEGMSFGLPVIAPNVGGPVEIITHGVQGLLIDPRDVSQVSDAIQWLVDDRARFESLSLAAVARARDYSPQSLVRNMHTLLVAIAR